MTQKKDNFYRKLSDYNQDLFDKIEDHSILGASNHLEIIGSMFIDIVRYGKENDINASENLANLEDLADYFIESRGNASRAVYNGILAMLIGVKQSELKDNNALVEKVTENVESFEKLNNKNLEKILNYSALELDSSENILLFDYSSTVEKAIRELAKDESRKINIFVSESSAIDGGKPYFVLSEYNNITISFFPDAALYYYLKKSDCCLMGAETFYPDGTGFNTIGSDMVGRLCTQLDIPLYFITPLNKLDIRRLKGQKKEPVYIDYREKYKSPADLSYNFNTSIPELIGVDPKDIQAFICEEGVIPSNQMFSVSVEYDRNLRRANDEQQTIK